MYQVQGLQEQRAEAERLLQEALFSWRQAQEVLKEVRELQSQTLRRQRRKTYRELDQEPEQDQRPNQTDEHDGCQRQDQDPDKGTVCDLSKSSSQSEGRTESETAQTPAEAESEIGHEESTPEGLVSSNTDS